VKIPVLWILPRSSSKTLILKVFPNNAAVTCLIVSPLPVAFHSGYSVPGHMSISNNLIWSIPGPPLLTNYPRTPYISKKSLVTRVLVPMILPAYGNITAAIPCAIYIGKQPLDNKAC
jgi:hypothetical protein